MNYNHTIGSDDPDAVEKLTKDFDERANEHTEQYHLNDNAIDTRIKHQQLTSSQSYRVNALIRCKCCNYDNGNCILLDDGETCVCPQTISYSLICKWFKTAVLPQDKELTAELCKNSDLRRCSVCDAAFASGAHNIKYCPDCRELITRKQAAERIKKRRSMLRSKD